MKKYLIGILSSIFLITSALAGPIKEGDVLENPELYSCVTDSQVDSIWKAEKENTEKNGSMFYSLFTIGLQMGICGALEAYRFEVIEIHDKMIINAETGKKIHLIHLKGKVIQKSTDEEPKDYIPFNAIYGYIDKSTQI